MTRKYKLERLQKKIFLGISGAALASTIFFGGAQDNLDHSVSQDVAIISPTVDTSTEASIEIKVLNKALKERKRQVQDHTPTE